MLCWRPNVSGWVDSISRRIRISDGNNGAWSTRPYRSMFHVETNNFWLSRATSPRPHSIEPALPFDASASCKAVVFTHGRLHLSHSDHLHSNTQLSVISTFFLSGRARLTLWSPLGWLSFNIFLFYPTQQLAIP